MNAEVDFKSIRVRKIRLWQRIGDSGYSILVLLFVLFSIGAAFCFVIEHLSRLGYLSSAIALLMLMVALWYRYDLRTNAPNHPPKSLDDVIAPSLLARLREPLTPRSVWDAAVKDPAAAFVCNRLFLDASMIAGTLSTDTKDMSMVWNKASQLAQASESEQLHAGTLAAALILTSNGALAYITTLHVNPEDVTEVYMWLDRQLRYMGRPKPYFGGLGRDWAAGFTPTLEKFGQNVSHDIEMWGGYGRFASHGDMLPGIANNLAQGTAVALVGPAGVGKTELVFALTDRLLSGQVDGLRYYQIVSLDASAIISSSDQHLETLLTYLFGEAVAANNIILYLDEAQLFFSHGVGAFDISQLLLPVLKNRQLKVIASFTPNEWQRVKASNESLAAMFSPVILNEPAPEAVMNVVEDSTILLELHQKNLLITYEAIHEAYRLSGQYMQEEAYPGKTISLLEQAVPYVQNNVMMAETVQEALEKMRGVRVSKAAAPEADMLLHLEDRIHERMIDQKQAVNAVASALRRSRAGVANPKRPVGSFLFLGPTGVGKTELARSLAGVYFGDERQMIRLDMSEYQNADDVTRLLHGSGEGGNSLLTAVRAQPFSVVLLDEIEKAHPNILNLLLQMLDEGQLTDAQGKPASFRSCIIIATSNAGATDIIARVRAQGPLDDTFERPLLDKLISVGTFKPELVNRFDEIVLFRPLGQAELGQVAQLMLEEVNRTLAAQNVRVELTPAALEQTIRAGYDPEFGARPMRRVIQKTVEDAVAVKILNQQAQAGSTITLDVGDLSTPDNTTTESRQ
jgi:ATP-dependent Clp protease ATP-binding subunit ClpC